MIKFYREQYTQEEINCLREILKNGAEEFCCGAYKNDICDGCKRRNLCRDLLRTIYHLEEVKPVYKRG